MRISELSRASGVPLPTLKFYLREGLLQPGEATGPNQARYGEEHLRRLRFVRALRDAGGMGIASIRSVIAALDDEDAPLYEVLGIVVDALGESARGGAPVPGAEREAAAREVDAFLVSRGLPVREGAQSRESLVDALLAARSVMGEGISVEEFDPYERAVRELAREEGEMVRQLIAGRQMDREQIVEFVVMGTVLFEPVLLAFRRIWNEKTAAPSAPA